ncbi:MAG: hypothetical protein U5J63_09240 [Fodinibius sp.]|nr:hypothetical protein [Fodinibius sp.]
MTEKPVQQVLLRVMLLTVKTAVMEMGMDMSLLILHQPKYNSF